MKSRYVWFGLLFAAGSILLLVLLTRTSSAPSVLLSGGEVIWEGGTTFRVTPARYKIRGKPYLSPLSTVQLFEADPYGTRIDLIVATSSSSVEVLTGVPSAAPDPPVLNPAKQVSLAFVKLSPKSKAGVSVNVGLR